MPDLVTNTEPSFSKKTDFLEWVFVSTILEIEQWKVFIFVDVFLRMTPFTEHWFSIYLHMVIGLVKLVPVFFVALLIETVVVLVIHV